MSFDLGCLVRPHSDSHGQIPAAAQLTEQLLRIKRRTSAFALGSAIKRRTSVLALGPAIKRRACAYALGLAIAGSLTGLSGCAQETQTVLQQRDAEETSSGENGGNDGSGIEDGGSDGSGIEDDGSDGSGTGNGESDGSGTENGDIDRKETETDAESGSSVGQTGEQVGIDSEQWTGGERVLSGSSFTGTGTNERLEDESIHLVMVGDMLMHMTVVNSGIREDGSYNYDHLFSQIGEEIEDADLAIVNQETILGGGELGYSGYPTFNSPYEVGDAEIKTGFDVILHGTNHALDKGKAGLKNCIDFWKTNYPDIPYLGINESRERQEDYIYVYETDLLRPTAALADRESGNGSSAPAGDRTGNGSSAPAGVGTGNGSSAPAGARTGNGSSALAGDGAGNGSSAPAGVGTGNGSSAPAGDGADSGSQPGETLRIAILNYTYGTNGISTPSDMPFAVNYMDEDKVVSDIAKAHELADFVVVCPHWGTEYYHGIDSYQEKWTKIFLENDVDLVLGTHPHVIEPIELLKDEDGDQMLVYYSLGNFVNGTSSSGEVADRMVGGLAEVDIGWDENGSAAILDYGVTPLVCHIADGTDYTVYALEDYTEELAEANKIRGKASNFSLDYCQELVQEVWGEIVE